MIRLVSDMLRADPDKGGSSGGGQLPPGTGPLSNEAYAIWQIQQLLAKYPGAQLVDETHVLMPNGRIRTFERDEDGNPKLSAEWDQSASRAFLNTATAGGGGSGGSTARLTTDDPRYWQLQYDQLAQDERIAMAQLEQQYLNAGLDAESARRQALATLITNRNNASVDLARTSGDIAAQAAQFAANPRDAVADLMYRNAIGGSTPFGDTDNKAFGDYQVNLQNKFQELFGGVGGDLNRAREFVSSIPPAEFLRPSSNIPGIGEGTLPPQTIAPQAPVAQPNGLQSLMDRLNSFDDQQKDDFRKWVTAASGQDMKAQPMAMGGTISASDQPGFTPTSSEGGTNINLFEPAIVVGRDSGHIYATLAEPRPDGSRRGEQLIVKPLPSEVEKDKKMKEQGKKFVQSASETLKGFAGGGTISIPDTGDFIAQLRQQLSRLGGSGGGTGGYSTDLPSLRLLAGAPANALEEDLDLMDYTLAGYSAQGISPRTVASTIRRFTPTSAQRQGQTGVRVNF